MVSTGVGRDAAHAIERRRSSATSARFSHRRHSGKGLRGPQPPACALGEALSCALSGAAAAEAAAMWAAMERALPTEPGLPFAGPIARALLTRPPPSPQMERMLRTLDGHPRCGVHAAALRLRHAAAADASSRELVTGAAQAALRSPCWRLKATALDVFAQIGATPDPGAPLPSFLVRVNGRGVSHSRR